MKILLDPKKIVVAKGEVEDLGGNAYKLDGRIYPAHLELTCVEYTGKIRVQKDKFINGKVVENEDYIAPIEPETIFDIRKEIDLLKDELKRMK